MTIDCSVRAEVPPLPLPTSEVDVEKSVVASISVDVFMPSVCTSPVSVVVSKDEVERSVVKLFVVVRCEDNVVAVVLVRSAVLLVATVTDVVCVSSGVEVIATVAVVAGLVDA